MLGSELGLMPSLPKLAEKGKDLYISDSISSHFAVSDNTRSADYYFGALVPVFVFRNHRITEC